MNNSIHLNGLTDCGSQKHGVLLIMALAMVLVSTTTSSAQTVLYDVTFDSPAHVVDQPPTTGFGNPVRVRPTSIGGGTAVPDAMAEFVVASFLSMDRPCQLTPFDPVNNDSFAGIANLIFDLNDVELPASNRIEVSFDIALDSLPSTNNMAVFIDAPSIHRLGFSNSGELTVLSLNDSMTVGQYSTNQVYSVQMIHDEISGLWSVIFDGTEIFSGVINTGNASSFRVGESTLNTNMINSIYVDNIQITGILLGDTNLDGVINLLDVDPFVESLVSGDFLAEADMNVDGNVDLLDVAFFVSALAG